MTDETPAKRGEAAWKEQRDAISKRNAETRKRGRTEQETNDNAAHARSRAHARDEAEQLHMLNERIAKQRMGRSR